MTENDAKVWSALRGTLAELIINKPNDRSEKDRRYAVMITEMEKIVAYCGLYLVAEDIPMALSED